MAKDGKKGKGQSAGLPNEIVKLLLDSVFPDKKALTLMPKKEKGQKGQKDQKSDNKKDGQGMVGTYARSIENHMLRHYEMFAATMSGGAAGSQLNLMDLIYYHTFGDYRMVFDGGLKFEYATLKKSQVGLKPHYKGNQIDRLVSRTGPADGVNYVYAVDLTSDPRKVSYEVGEVKWMSQELNKGSAGMRLMLPSIGTLMMTTYGYGNINKPLSALLNKLLTKINSVLRDIEEDSDVLNYLKGAIESDSRWPAIQPVIEATKTIETIVEDSMKKYVDDNASWEETIKYFVEEIVESSTSRYVADEDVKIKPGASLSNDEESELIEVVGADNDFEEELFTINRVVPRGKTFDYELKYDTQILGVYKQNLLIPSGEGKGPFMEKQNKSFVRIPPNETIVFYSILVDQIFALQAYLFTIKSANKLNFGYLSPSIMPIQTSKASEKLFPNMYDPNRDTKPSQNEYLKTKGKGKSKIKANNCFLAQLAVHRNLFTQLVLKTQRSMAIDTRNFDLFYNEDLTLKEIKWLATALSDEAKVLVAEPDKSDPLAQLVYRETGAAESVQLTGEANRRTVFYRVDIPMLKEVMLEYVRVFNEFTIKAAFAVQSSDAIPKEGAIAKALWTSLKKRSTKLLENNEAIPHEFFNTLFEEVRAAATDTKISFDLYPPNWSDSNILTKLTVDPAQLNTILSTEEYQTYLNEYIDYIQVRYGNRAKVASAITTSLESYRIKAAANHEELQAGFMEMITEHEKKKQLKATTFEFRAYSAVIAIMRGQLAVPLSFREDMIAEGIERAALSEQLKGRDYGERGIAAAPPEHPLSQLRRKQTEDRSARDQAVRERAAEEARASAEQKRIDRIPKVTLTGIGLYAPPPAVVASSDTVNASRDGGTEVIIFGRGFTREPGQIISVTFDGVEAFEFRVLSPTQILARTPSSVDGLAVGTVDVVVTKSLRTGSGITELSSDKLDSNAATPQGLIYV